MERNKWGWQRRDGAERGGNRDRKWESTRDGVEMDQMAILYQQEVERVMHREDIDISSAPDSSTSVSSSCFVVSDSPKSPSMQADGWISAPALPLFSLLDSAEGLHPKAGGKEQGSWFCGSFCRIRQEAGEGAPKEAKPTFHLFPLTVRRVYALHVSPLFSVSLPHRFFFCFLTL